MSERWDTIISLLQEQRFADAIAHLDAVSLSNPIDVDAYLLRAVAQKQLGLTKDAEIELWRALVIDPSAAGVRAALSDLFVQDPTLPGHPHDFELDSGERQTSPQIEMIRRDHSARYEFAAHWLRGHLQLPRDATGLDLFCGNGYGARILADRCGARIVGIDGSAPAVAVAETAYGGHRVVFRQACFPFELTRNAADFAVCFESVEHVEDCDDFLRQVGAATHGPILLSFPLEKGLPFAINRDLFRFHFRHFNADEMAEKLLRLTGRRVTEMRGQTVYRVENGRMSGLLHPSQMELTRLRDDSQFGIVIAV
ncbi:methyltransferase domain-containing protein [Rhodopseudomonas sp. NSM]|uniref:methyltransferase domain-containing protein n=1 Tax=Rhodopseudomonas sp. NSM TaxID=3457630 RepID=UPI004035B24B